jgi:hypothetical protein
MHLLRESSRTLITRCFMLSDLTWASLKRVCAENFNILQRKYDFSIYKSLVLHFFFILFSGTIYCLNAIFFKIKLWTKLYWYWLGVLILFVLPVIFGYPATLLLSCGAFRSWWTTTDFIRCKLLNPGFYAKDEAQRIPRVCMSANGL